MSQHLKSILAIYLSGFLQGIALVLYPAAGSIFTSTDYHGLSSGEFGILFTPQIVFAIVASLSAPRLAQKYTMKRVLMWGMLSNLLSMLFFAGSAFCIGSSSLPFWSLMLGTAALGAGFGFTITALNPFAYHLFPGKEASAVTGMHVFLGLGTTSAALLLNTFLNLDMWWAAGLAVAAAVLLLLLFQWSLPLRLPQTTVEGGIKRKSRIPLRIWLYALLIFLYAFSEATFGNWGMIYLEKEARLSPATAALGLSIFWAAITTGRIIFSMLALRFNTIYLYLIAPFAVALVFFLMPGLSGKSANLIAMAFGGLGLSFYFPNTISMGTDEFPQYAAVVSGALVAAIQIGTGLSANVIGVLNTTFSLGTLFQVSASYGLLTGLLGCYLYMSGNKSKSQLSNV